MFTNSVVKISLDCIHRTLIYICLCLFLRIHYCIHYQVNYLSSTSFANFALCMCVCVCELHDKRMMYMCALFCLLAMTVADEILAGCRIE